MKRLIPIIAFLLILIVSVSITAQVHLEVPLKPMPFRADGKTHLLYELHITNFRSNPLELMQIDISNEETDAKPLASFGEKSLADLISNIGAKKRDEEKRMIDAGQRAVVFVQISFDPYMPVPNVLQHRLHFKLAKSETAPLIIEEKGFTVKRRTPPIINPPLRGDGWIAFNGVSNNSGHRRTIIPLNGRATIAQRFAIDWVKIGANGKIFKNNLGKNEEIHGYGEDVRAVSDAVVVDVNDGIPDNDMSSEKKAVPITLETIGGNYVILDIGNGYYAFYAHLIPKSIIVKIGDEVEVGQVIGRLGNSGNSDGPHLHFHITDENSPLGAEGVPYLIKSFEFRGKTSPDKVFAGEIWNPSDNKLRDIRLMEIPLENSIVRFH